MVSTYDIRDSFDDIQSMLQGQIKMKSITLTDVYDGFNQRELNSKYLVRTDKRRVEQVLLNLLTNAVKFTGRNGAIKVIIEYLHS